MSMILKHLWRTVRRAPVRPLLILFTVIASTVVFVLSARLPEKLNQSFRRDIGADIVLGDITVTEGRGDVRFLFKEDLEPYLSENDKLLSEFLLSGYLRTETGTQSISVSATDLEAADDFYRFSYREYGVFTTENILRSAIVSDTLARENGLHVGSYFTVTILGKTLSLRVEAIAVAENLLKARDLLVDEGVVRHLLAEKNPLIASLGDTFTPATAIYLKSTDKAASDALFSALSDSPIAKDALITRQADEGRYVFFTLIAQLIIVVPALLLLLLSLFTVITSLELLFRGRREEYELFRLAGASARTLSLLQLTEGVLYGLVGGVIGTLLSIPLFDGATALCAWQDFPLRFAPTDAIAGILFAPLFMALCTLLRLHRGARENKRKTGKKTALALLVLTALSVAATALTPPIYRYIPAITTLLLFFLTLFTTVPILVDGAAKGLHRLVEGKKERPLPTLLYALKSIRNVFALRHVARLLSVLLALLFTITVSIDALSREGTRLSVLLCADHVAVGADDTTYRLLDESADVSTLSRFSFYEDVLLAENGAAIALSADGSIGGFLEGSFLPKTLPAGSEAAISVGIAARLALSVGDSFDMTVKGVRHTYTVSEILPTGTNLVFIDAPSALGMKNDLIAIRTADTDTASESISTLIEPRGASLSDPDALFGKISRVVLSYLSLLRYAFLIALVVILIGVCNVLSETYHARKNEGHLYAVSGVTKGALLRLRALEVLIVLSFSLLFAVASTALLSLLVNVSVHAFGFALFV